jgi:hypothetical protein
MRLRRTARDGLSLFEVIIALATFLLSLVGLTFLLNVAGNTALETQFRTQGASLCHSKLAEITAGAVPLEAQSGVPFDEDPHFLWSLEVEPGSVQGLHHVTVRVSRKRPEGTMMEVALSQMVLDPKMIGSIHDVPGQITGESSPDPSTTSGSMTGGGMGMQGRHGYGRRQGRTRR